MPFNGSYGLAREVRPPFVNFHTRRIVNQLIAASANRNSSYDDERGTRPDSNRRVRQVVRFFYGFKCCVMIKLLALLGQSCW